MVQLPPNIEKVETENEQEVHDGLDVEALERLKEEEENPPQTFRSSIWKISQPNMYNYSLFDFKWIFSLFSNINDPRSKK
jgi:hypothetical protein